MNNDEKPGPLASADNLPTASLEAVLLYGLTFADDDPALGVLLGARCELGLIASLAESSLPGADFDLTEIVPVIEGIGRRIDVAIELMSRANRTRTTSEPLAPDAGPTRNGRLRGTGGAHDRG
jgi:hypothetical protein